MYLPTATPVAGRWGVWDYRRKLATSSPADAEGECSAELPQVPGDELWFLDRLTTLTDSDARSSAFLYVDQVDDNHLIDGTNLGNFAPGDFSAPHLLESSQTLIVQWRGMTPGAVGRFQAQYTVMRREGTN